MNAKARLNINLDRELKEQTARALEEIGLDFTTAINVYFRKIVNTKSIPFELSTKTRYSIEEIAGENWRDGLDEMKDEWV